MSVHSQMASIDWPINVFLLAKAESWSTVVIRASGLREYLPVIELNDRSLFSKIMYFEMIKEM